MSLSSTSSPTFCSSFLICSSLSASSSLGRDRSAFSAPTKNRSFHSSASATFSPCLGAASCAEVSPLMMLMTSVTRRFAVQSCASSCGFSAIALHLPAATPSRLMGGFNLEGSRILDPRGVRLSRCWAASWACPDISALACITQANSLPLRFATTRFAERLQKGLRVQQCSRSAAFTTLFVERVPTSSASVTQAQREA